MLYVTTRGTKDAYTAHNTLISNFAADNGRYVPFRFPKYEQNELSELVSCSFSEIVSRILNHFFSLQLNGWDVECCIGRTPVKVANLGRKTLVAQAWCNPEKDYAYIERILFGRMLGTQPGYPTEWAKIAIKLAVLFGIYREILDSNMLSSEDTFDIAADTKDFSDVMAAWYAKQIGLPIGRIVLCCSGNTALWDFVHRNELNTTLLDGDLRHSLERLICTLFGEEEVARYIEFCDNRRVYYIEDENNAISNHFFCAVVGKSRIPAVINSVFQTGNHLIDPETAISFGAVQDYRAKSGENRITLLFAEKAPILFADDIIAATGINEDNFYDIAKKS